MKPPVGRVYVLSNKAMPGLLKIGYTMNTVEGRVKELSSATGVPSEFFIEYQVECRDPMGVEALVHESLQSSRHNDSREFFAISLPNAIALIRKYATEIIDEEIADSIEAGHSVDNAAATFYLVKVSSSRNIFRVGLIKKEAAFLNTDEFKAMIVDLYNHFDSKYFYDCIVIQSKEFSQIDSESLEKMKGLLDGNIRRLKTLNRAIFDRQGFCDARDLDQRLNGKYDLRTLPFIEYKESFPIQIYNSTLSLIEPVAQACLRKSAPESEISCASGAMNFVKQNRLALIKEMGI
jgi:hypothetical protein